MPDPGGSDERSLELLRECVPLRLDREGRWFHDGEPVTHPGIAAALHRWIDRDDASGRYVLRAGPEWCFIEVEDAPYVVRGVTLTGERTDVRVELLLSDGTREPLDPATLRQAPDNVLYCDVKDGRMPARFDRASYFHLADLVEFEADRPVLVAHGRRWPIAYSSSTSPK